MPQLIFTVLALFSLGVSLVSLHKVKHGQFYSDTPWLAWMGVFVWGDGVILGPFWALSSLLFFQLSALNILRYLLIFFLVRSIYEAIYWINHQVAQRSYNPPLFRRFRSIGPNEAAILYQLLHTCVIVLAAVGLILTFVGLGRA